MRALGLAARQCCGLKREDEELLPADEQVGDDGGRAAVKTCVRHLPTITSASRVHLGAHLVKSGRQPPDVAGSRLRIQARIRIPLAGAKALGVDVAGCNFDHEHACDQVFP
jgi:hypothetical protein